jgi:hypothetical protein
MSFSINMALTRVDVSAKRKSISHGWTCEMGQKLTAIHGIRGKPGGRWPNEFDQSTNLPLGFQLPDEMEPHCVRGLDVVNWRKVSFQDVEVGEHFIFLDDHRLPGKFLVLEKSHDQEFIEVRWSSRDKRLENHRRFTPSILRPCAVQGSRKDILDAEVDD